jgi:hypothetical protein
MVKHFVLIPKRADVANEVFHEHWRDNHSQLAMMIRSLERYTQSHRLEPAAPGWSQSPFDGIAECGFADLDGAYGLSTNPDYTENAKEDDPNFIAIEDLGFFTCELPEVLRSGPAILADTPGVKVMLLLTRPDQLDPAEFQAALGALAPRLAGLTPMAHTILLCLPVLETYGKDPEPAYDAIAEVYYPDRAAYEAEWNQSGEQAFELLAPILDSSSRSSASPYDETRFIWPSGDDG